MSRLSLAPRLPSACVLLLVLLVLPGCRLRSTVDVEVARQGSGTLRVTLAADRDLVERAAAAQADPLGDLAAAGEELAARGWQVAQESEADGGRRVELSVGFASPEEFTAVAGELTRALAAPEVTPLSGLRLEAVGDRFEFAGDAGLRFTPAVAELGLDPAAAAELLADGGVLDYRVTVRLPGEIVSTTAPVRLGNQLVWPIRPGQRVRIAAVGLRPPPPWWARPLPIGAGVVTVVALGLGAAFFLRRARRRGAANRARRQA